MTIISYTKENKNNQPVLNCKVFAVEPNDIEIIKRWDDMSLEEQYEEYKTVPKGNTDICRYKDHIYHIDKNLI